MFSIRYYVSFQILKRGWRPYSIGFAAPGSHVICTYIIIKRYIAPTQTNELVTRVTSLTKAIECCCLLIEYCHGQPWKVTKPLEISKLFKQGLTVELWEYFHFTEITLLNHCNHRRPNNILGKSHSRSSQHCQVVSYFLYLIFNFFI